MSRYIDADAFDNTVQTLNEQGWNITRSDYKRMDRVLFEMPTADVVEVVRCKDCLFGHRCFQVINGVADSWVECINPDGLKRTVSDDGFCSAFIERREDEQIH